MADIVQRINAQEAHQHLERGNAILVCAYEDEAKCTQNHLAGAIHMDQFRARINLLPKDQEMIFYCA